MSRKRQKLHQEAVRAQILETAKTIVINEGLNSLSIRKITNQMDYSPGIIYHYFKDKNALLDALILDGYMCIVSSIKAVEAPMPHDPALYLRQVMKRFIETALEQRVMYRLFLLSDSPEIAKHTVVLKKGISETSPTMKMLTDQIRQGMALGVFASADPELTAQVLWAAVYGLIMKLIVESDLPAAHQANLIDAQLDLLLRGLSA